MPGTNTQPQQETAIDGILRDYGAAVGKMSKTIERQHEVIKRLLVAVALFAAADIGVLLFVILRHGG